MLRASELRALVANEYSYELLDQDIVPETRIFSVVFRTGQTRRLVYVAAPPSGEWSMLTGHVEHFNAVARLAPRDLADATRARRYAGMADTWTTSFEYGQLAIASIDDIPWSSWLDERDQRKIADVKARFGIAVGPERVSA